MKKIQLKMINRNKTFTLIIDKLNSSLQSAKHLNSNLVAPTATSVPLNKKIKVNK